MVTLFHVTGAYIYVDPDGTPNGVEDGGTKLENARQHHASNGTGLDLPDSLVR